MTESRVAEALEAKRAGSNSPNLPSLLFCFVFVSSCCCTDCVCVFFVLRQALRER
jgi:hypothetical protein